jgi:membrane-associated protein
MSAVYDYLLTFVIAYGAPFLGFVLLFGSAGIPVPTTLLVIAAGAFMRQGILNWPLTMIIGLGSTVLGDSLSFAIGRFGGDWIKHRFNTTNLWLQAQTAFEQRGAWAVFLTRFLVCSLALPVNLIAGGSDFSYPRFLILDVLGEMIWLTMYGSLGYIFGNEWETISQFVSDFSGLTLGLAVLAIGLYIWLRQRKNAQLRQENGLKV